MYIPGSLVVISSWYSRLESSFSHLEFIFRVLFILDSAIIFVWKYSNNLDSKHWMLRWSSMHVVHEINTFQHEVFLCFYFYIFYVFYFLVIYLSLSKLFYIIKFKTKTSFYFKIILFFLYFVICLYIKWINLLHPF